MPRMPRDIAASTRKNFWKRLRWSRSEMPMPSSETRSSTTRRRLRTRTVTVPPSGEYLMALSIRLISTWRTRSASASASAPPGRQHERELVLLGAAAGPGRDVARDGRDVDRGELQPDGARLEARGAEQRLDEPVEPLGLARDVADERRAVLLAEARVLAQQRLGEAVDRGQRRAQLVRDGGHEVALELLERAHLGDVAHREHAARAGRRRRSCRPP